MQTVELNQNKVKLNTAYCIILFVTAFLPILCTIWTKEYNPPMMFTLSLIVFAIQGICQIVAGIFLLKKNKIGWAVGFIHIVCSLIIVGLRACYTVIVFLGVGFVSLFASDLNVGNIFWSMILDSLYLDLYIFGMIYYLVKRKYFVQGVIS